MIFETYGLYLNNLWLIIDIDYIQCADAFLKNGL